MHQMPNPRFDGTRDSNQFQNSVISSLFTYFFYRICTVFLFSVILLDVKIQHVLHLQCFRLKIQESNIKYFRVRNVITLHILSAFEAKTLIRLIFNQKMIYVDLE